MQYPPSARAMMPGEEMVRNEMDFGPAITARKTANVYRVRAGTARGCGRHICPVAPALPAVNFWSPCNRAFVRAERRDAAEVLPCITMKTADNKILMGWLASQTDMLSEDWVILSDGEEMQPSS